MPSHRPHSVMSSSELAVILILLMPSRIYLFSVTIKTIILSIPLLQVLLTDLDGAFSSLDHKDALLIAEDRKNGSVNHCDTCCFIVALKNF